MKCKYTEEEMLLYYYDEVDLSLKKEMEEHFRQCGECGSVFASLKEDLDALGIPQPEMSGAFWNDYRTAVREKVDGRPARKDRGRLMPLTVRYAASALLLLAVVFGGLKVYDTKKEHAFIMKNYDLINELEMFEDLELFENLEDIENV